ncbi:MAG: hypothetical protein HY718_20725, partial [Planctomycetes bacterium]|nr:hypothetical protein [Planctomycetota bacterium]
RLERDFYYDPNMGGLDWKAVGACVNMGVPLAESAPKSRTRQAIRELAERIVGAEDPGVTGGRERGNGLLGRIFSAT